MRAFAETTLRAIYKTRELAVHTEMHPEGLEAAQTALV